MSIKMELYQLICTEIIDKSLNKYEAKDKLARILDDYCIEKHEPNPLRFDLKLKITEFLSEKEKSGLTKKTIKHYRNELEKFSNYTDKQVNQISKDDVKDYLLNRNDGSMSNNTMITIRSTLKSFFEWLRETNVRSDNPVSLIRPHKISKASVEVFAKDEIEKIRVACTDSRDRALIEFMYSTGCILHEITCITLDCLNLNSGEAYIKGKDARNRTVYLSKQAVDSLKKMIAGRSDDCPYVFITFRKPFRKLGSRMIEQILVSISNKSGLDKRLSVRSFRHTFTRQMLDNGCQMHVLQALLGHKKLIATSESYGLVEDQNQKKAFVKFFPE